MLRQRSNKMCKVKRCQKKNLLLLRLTRKTTRLSCMMSITRRGGALPSRSPYTRRLMVQVLEMKKYWLRIQARPSPLPELTTIVHRWSQQLRRLSTLRKTLNQARIMSTNSLWRRKDSSTSPNLAGKCWKNSRYPQTQITKVNIRNN
jgi:hypothetical protein